MLCAGTSENNFVEPANYIAPFICLDTAATGAAKPSHAMYARFYEDESDASDDEQPAAPAAQAGAVYMMDHCLMLDSYFKPIQMQTSIFIDA